MGRRSSLALLLAFSAAGCGRSDPVPLRSRGWTPTDCSELPGADCAQWRGPRPFGCHQSPLSLAEWFGEDRIRAQVHGGRVTVALELRGNGDCPLAGTAEVQLLDVVANPERPLAFDARGFAAVGPTRVVLSLGGLEPALGKAELARYVLSYRVQMDGGEVRGRKSLFEAVEKLEALVLAPESMPAAARTHLRVMVRDPSTGAALPGAEVLVSAQPKEGAALELWSGRTDAAGQAVAAFDAPDLVGDASLVVRVVHANGEETVQSPLRLVRDRRILFTTDKPLYQPGQTIHLRTLTLRRPSLRPEAEQEVVFEVRDAKGNKVGRRRVRSDAFGIAATDFRIAGEVNQGAWKLVAAMGEAAVEKEVKVERYRLPRFKVAVSTVEPYYLPGGQVRGELSAQYFFGKPVAGGAVVLLVSAAGEGLATNVARITGTTNGSGLYSFALTLPSLPAAALEKGGARLELSATVTDTAQSAQTAAHAVPLAAGPLVVTVLPESGRAAPGLANTFYVAVSDPTGRPVQASLALSGPGLAQNAATDVRGLASFTWTPPVANAALEVTARTAAGAVHRQSYFVGQSAPILVRADRAVYRAGDRAAIEVLVPPGVEQVLLDVLREGQSLVAATLAVEGGVARYPLPLTSAMTGGLQVDASYLTRGGVVRGVRPLYVDPANDLTVSVELVDAGGAAREEFRPGEEARLRFRVTNEAGEPEPAALGLTVVDEAVFALTEMRPGLERAYFNLGAQRLGDARVAGYSAADVVTAPTLDERDLAARLLFAGGGAAPGLGLAIDTYARLRSRAVAAVKPRIDRDLAAISQALREQAWASQLDWSNQATFIPAFVGDQVDPFGQRYRATAGDSQVTLRCAGPDERPGTEDDLSSTVELWSILGGGWRWDDVDADADGCPMCDFGGPMAANAGPPAEGVAGADKSDAPRVRSFFPETLFVEPSLIAGADGRAEIALPLADSITTWRLSALANSAAGRLGSVASGVRVFQEFFADVDFPPALTRGDEVSVPVVVHNYLALPQTVTLRVEPASWFTLLDAAQKSLTLGAGEVRAVSFRLRATQAGPQALTVTAIGSRVSDAVRRTADVAPDGREVVVSASARLTGPVEHRFAIPANAVPGASQLLVKIYPGALSQAVEGLDSMLRAPSGCFEQTTSTVWPNVMVLAYLRGAGKVNPVIEEKALRYIGAGYQRLLTFEKAGGGFGWWPQANEAPNRTLTAIALMELHDMAQVYEIDPAVLERSRRFIVGTQLADGSWPAGDALHAGNETLSEKPERATAFIAWALLRAGDTSGAGQKALGYLRGKIDGMGTYELSLAANAFLAHSSGDLDALRILSRIDARKTADAAGARWIPEGRTFTGGSGDTGGVEVTGLATTALLRAGAYPTSVDDALKWLAGKKDAMGTWYNTQATVNALRALVDSLAPAAGGDVAAQITVSVDGVPAESFSITPDDADLVRVVDLSALATSGERRVSLGFAGTGALQYQIVARHYAPWSTGAAASALGLEVAWSRAQLRVGESAQVTAAVVNRTAGTQDQVMVEVGLPPGFAASAEDLDALVAQSLAARYELRGRQVAFYLMGVAPSERRELRFRAQAGMAGAVSAPESRAWLYYAPEVRAESAPVPLAVAE